MKDALKEIYGITDKKEEEKKTEKTEDFIEGPTKWEIDDAVKPWHYKAVIENITIRVKKQTVGNKVFHFEVPGDHFIDFKIMNTEKLDIKLINDEEKNPTILTFAETKNGPFYNFSLVREDENVWFKESIIVADFPSKLPSTLFTYKIQTHNLNCVDEDGNITFYDPHTKEAFFSMQKPYLIVEDGEQLDLFKYEIRKEGINVFLDLVMIKPFPIDTNLEFYEIDPTIYTTEKGTLGRNVQVYNELLVNAVFLATLLAGFILIYKFKDKITGKEKKETSMVV